MPKMVRVRDGVDVVTVSCYAEGGTQYTLAPGMLLEASHPVVKQIQGYNDPPWPIFVESSATSATNVEDASAAPGTKRSTRRADA